MNSDNSVNLDEIVIGGLEPQTWYTFVQAQIELLRGHVQERETQIQGSADDYERAKVATHVEYGEDEFPIVILEEHLGVEAPPDELRDIFTYYYPNLQRRSILIILFSFVERQLDQLCELLAKERRTQVTHTDLRGKGIDRARLYLQKVAGLPVDSSAIWQEIKRIQKLRNVVVHNDAKLAGADKDFLEYVEKTSGISRANKSHYDGDGDEVDIEEGYLIHVLDAFDLYCGEVNKAINT